MSEADKRENPMRDLYFTDPITGKRVAACCARCLHEARKEVCSSCDNSGDVFQRDQNLGRAMDNMLSGASSLCGCDAPCNCASGQAGEPCGCGGPCDDTPSPNPTPCGG